MRILASLNKTSRKLKMGLNLSKIGVKSNVFGFFSVLVICPKINFTKVYTNI